jgi:hypothetical protein
VKFYTLCLPYYKQGDDLALFLEKTDNDSAALKAHANTLRDAAEILDRCSEYADQGMLSIEEADTHMITVEPASEEVGDKLAQEGLLIIDESYDDSEEEWTEEE